MSRPTESRGLGPGMPKAAARHSRSGGERDGLLAFGQWNESPQAQEPEAFGLSIVKPCFSIVSTKSMLAPLR
jgi:hypothetical protein